MKEKIEHFKNHPDKGVLKRFYSSYCLRAALEKVSDALYALSGHRLHGEPNVKQGIEKIRRLENTWGALLTQSALRPYDKLNLNRVIEEVRSLEKISGALYAGSGRRHHGDLTVEQAIAELRRLDDKTGGTAWAIIADDIQFPIKKLNKSRYFNGSG